MPDVTPYWKPGSELTAHVEADVVGGRFVDISGPRVDGNPQVSPAAAAGNAFGVAARDKAAGNKVMLFKGPGAIVPVFAEAALAAGQEVQVGAAAGAVVLAAGRAVGRAVDDAAAGAFCPVEIY